MRSTCFAPLVALALALAGCLPEGSGGADDLTPPYDDDDLVVPDDDDIGDLDDDDTPSPDDDDGPPGPWDDFVCPFGDWGDDDDSVSDDDDVVDDDDTQPDDDDVMPDDDDTHPDDDDVMPDDDDTQPDDDDVMSDDDDLSTDDDDAVPDDDDTEEPSTCDDAFEAPQTKFLSADDSNSQAQPPFDRHMLLDGGSVPWLSKPWEYLNYYDFAYAPAEAGHLSIQPQLAERTDEPGVYDMLIGVVAPTETVQSRLPFNLVFSVDRSGSTAGPGMAAIKATLEAIGESLRAGDVISVVTWDTTNTILLDSYVFTGPGDRMLEVVADCLEPGGSTNLNSGLQAAYALAQANYAPGWTNRVILMSDGGANVGVTSATLIAEQAQDGEAEGIYLTGIGVPMSWASGYNHALMDEVTDLGKGAYVFVDEPAEAVDRFTPETLPTLLQVAARDVQLGVTLPPGFVVDVFTGEEMGSTPSEVEPQHLSPDDQMLYDLDLRDCSPDETTADLEFQFTVEWIDPLTGQSHLDTTTRTVVEMLAEPHRELVKAQALVDFSLAFAEVTSLPFDERADHLDGVIAQLQSAVIAFPTDPDLPEVLALAEVWRDLY